MKTVGQCGPRILRFVEGTLLTSPRDRLQKSQVCQVEETQLLEGLYWRLKSISWYLGHTLEKPGGSFSVSLPGWKSAQDQAEGVNNLKKRTTAQIL